MTVTFGIATAPQQVAYEDIQRVWREADDTVGIDHAWLFDHLMPIWGDPSGPIFEGWTLLAAMAAQTERLRLGLLVTSNRFRPPALLAKIAATVDVVSHGRLDFGIGAGSNVTVPIAAREYEAYGLPFHGAPEAVERLDESLTIIRRLWTETEPFDLDDGHHRLVGAIGNPKPVQRPHPPILIGGRATPTLRVAARHADIWGFPGRNVEVAAGRSQVLDRLCAEIGRDPASITRSLPLEVSDDADAMRTDVERAVAAGFEHLIFSLPAPFPAGLVGWLAEEVVPAGRAT